MAQLLLVGARASSLARFHDRTPTHTHTHTVVLLWKGDQPDAETSNWKHTTVTRNRRHAPGGIRTRNSSKRAAAYHTSLTPPTEIGPNGKI